MSSVYILRSHTFEKSWFTLAMAEANKGAFR